MRAKSSNKGATLPFDRSLFRPGDRVCAAVSGGADSTALLRVLAAARGQMGIVLSVVHVHHGIRGPEADADALFVAALAAELDLTCDVVRVDAPAHAAVEKISLETAARNLRYAIFWRILELKKADVLATAHTLDDQAETVLMKVLRGAWTEGLSGIHPVLLGEGAPTQRIVRPLLNVRRTEIESYLHALGQHWREDATNRDPAHTRNRVRHHLLPLMREYNPLLDAQLARMATLARDEEAYWQGELARILPGLLLPGKPVRGGGRSVPTEPGHASAAMEVQRLLAYGPAVRRRVLRATVEYLGASLDFDHTEALLHMLEGPPSATSRRLQLADGLFAERSARELRLERNPKRSAPPSQDVPACPEYELPIPGTLDATAYGLRFTVTLAAHQSAVPTVLSPATLRAWKPGDRVWLQHSRGPKKVKEVLERMHVHGSERQSWPVVVWQGSVIWMQGVAVTPIPIGEPQVKGFPIAIEASPLPPKTENGRAIDL